jgi:multidrug efflux pump
MGVFVLPNANSIDVVKRVRVEMEQIQRELPTGMEGRIAYDGTAYINTAIKDVFHTLLETLLIVMIVIYLFLGSWRSVIIPIVAIPISLIGAVFLMQILVQRESAHPPRDRARSVSWSMMPSWWKTLSDICAKD